MHEEYTAAFCSNTNLIFIVALKIACSSISFSSIFYIIFHVFLYLLFVISNEGTRKTGWVIMQKSEELTEKNIRRISVFESM